MALRRRTVVLATAASLLCVGALCVGAVAALTQTDRGRALIMRALVPTIAGAIPGRLYVGRVGGTLFTDLTIDSLSITEPNGRPFISTGPIRVTYDPRDLLDRRIVLKTLEVTRPVVTLVDYGNDDWNWKRSMRKRGPRLPQRPGSFGQFVQIDTATVHEGTLIARLPWSPSDSLKGAKRDSAIAYELSRLDGEVRRDGNRLVRVWRFERGDLALGKSRLADPDSAGQRFAFQKFDVVWVYPPFWFRNMKTTIRKVDDSLWVDDARFNLANSAGHGNAKVVWGNNLPVRYDVRIHGDTVAMQDVAWIDPSLPRTGGGSTDLVIKNDPADLRVIEYALTNMDARAMQSHLRGRMTFGVGGPVLRVTDVGLDLLPAHTDLLKQFNLEPFPFDWQGELSGRVVARGGPLTRWALDGATLTYTDAHVPGAVSRAYATGMLNIYQPSEAILSGLDLRIDDLDLRTPRFVNPLFPEVNGFVRGSVRLDSLWYMATFSQADLLHVDGIGQPSHFTGSGRYAVLEDVHFDVDMQAAPLNYTMLSKSYPSLPLRGNAVGSIRASGVAEDFTLQTRLAGEGGAVTFDGRVDAFEPEFGATGTFRTRGMNLQNLFADAAYPITSINAVGDLALTGASLTSLRGPLRATIDQLSTVSDVRVFGGTAIATFDAGHVRLDSLSLESSALRATARGGIGLIASRRDTIAFDITLDSLGGVRPWFRSADSTARSLIELTDTLRGRIDVRGRLIGSVDSLDALGLSLDWRADGFGLAFGNAKTERATITLEVRDVLRSANGSLTMALDSALLAGLDVAEASGRATLRGGLAERFGLELRTPSESRVALAGSMSRRDSTNTIVLDTLTIRVDSAFAAPRGFTLAAPAVLRVSRNNSGQLDSLVLLHTDTGRVSLRASLSDSGVVGGRLDVDRVPLADIGKLLRTSRLTGGRADATLVVGGTRELPTIDGDVILRGATAGRLRIGDLVASAHYDSLRLAVDATVNVDGKPALAANAQLPLDLALFSGRTRQRNAPLSGRIVSTRTDLTLLEALFPDISLARGRLTTDVLLTGSWERPQLRGQLLMDSAALSLDNLGIRVERAEADIGLAGDTVYVRRFSATGATPQDSVGLSGMINFSDVSRPVFDLRLTANNFLAIDKARTASLTLTTTTPIALIGPSTAPRVTGAVSIDRGRVYIRALAPRRGLDLTDNIDVVDTTVSAFNSLLPRAPSSLMQNLVLDNVVVSIGDDVWLRSPEANLKLGGALRVTRSAGRDGNVPRLALSDSLTVERGTYQVNLGIARPGFEVERGVVRFFGDPELEPALDVTALHTVRTSRANSNRQSVRIRVALGGTIDRPTLALSSADNPPLPESDMLSYLVTGEPAYVLLGGTPYAEQGATLALRLAGSYLSSRLAGGRFDVVQVEPTALASGDALTRDTGLGILASTRVGVGGQIARNTYFTFSTGFCGLAPQTSGGSDALSVFARGLGAKVERQFSRGLSLALGLEPGSSAQACGRLGVSRTFQQTPPQIGLDFFRTWTF